MCGIVGYFRKGASEGPLGEVMLRMITALGCRDVARVDFRMDAQGDGGHPTVDTCRIIWPTYRPRSPIP